MRFLVFVVLCCALDLFSQECRLTPVTPAAPALKIEEGESALESQTFLTVVSTVSPSNQYHFVDSVNRIRRLEASGRMTTIAGRGARATDLAEGPALEAAMPGITQIVFSPRGEVHFIAVGRIWKIANGQIVRVAGTGRPGFNGDHGNALERNLGGVVNMAFDGAGRLLVVDGFNRVRQLDGNGELRVIAGSARVAAANGLTGDEGPATAAALSNPRQVIPIGGGRLWIRDLGGRHLREISATGIIDTIQTSFDTGISILTMANGTPSGITANRLLPILPNGQLDTTARPYPAFTGTPRAIGPNGALYFEGSARPEQRNPLVRSLGGRTEVVASAPSVPEVDGQAPPFGIWRNGALLYASSAGDKAGIFEARPGQAPRYVAGGGTHIGDAEGKAATDLTIFGVQTFTVDGAGRVIVSDVYRKRILVVETDGKVSELKDNAGQPILYGPLGAFGNLARITADNAGNIYWYSAGATPTGGVFTATIQAWLRADRSQRSITVTGLAAMIKLENGDAGVIAGNSATFRNVYPLTPAGLGAPLPGLRLLPLNSVAGVRGEPYFAAANRLFRGVTGRIEYLDLPYLPSGQSLTPTYAVSTGDQILVYSSADGGFYRLDNPAACTWQPQPRIAHEGIRNAATFGNPNTISPRQLITMFGTGLGPAEGQGILLDGALRAGAQAAPFPALTLGSFSGTIPVSALTGTALPVIYSDARQTTVQSTIAAPASGEYFLYFSWQGLTLIHDEVVRVVAATPGIFTFQGNATLEPVAAGASVTVYATGLGALTGTLGLGDNAPLNALLPTTNAVTIEIAGQAAEVSFAGAAPGQIGGLYQVNVTMPAGLAAGTYPLRLAVAGQSAPSAQVVVR
jgi:uncharacterized protein (TIGR03437 family)